jgi:hypothetical protein
MIKKGDGVGRLRLLRISRRCRCGKKEQGDEKARPHSIKTFAEARSGRNFDMLKGMRFQICVLAALLLFGSAARGEQAPPAIDRPPAWYASWSLILGGGAMTLVGTAFTLRDSPDATFSAKNQTGWALVGIGTGTWIGGILLLRFSGSRPSSDHR